MGAETEALSLSALGAMVRHAVDSLPQGLWVRAELSDGRVGSGGHFYGEAVEKDPSGRGVIARARLTCWASVYARLGARFQKATGRALGPGMQVMLRVRATFHEQYGFALNVVDIDPTYTIGEVALRRQKIIAQLRAEGVIDDNRQLALPRPLRRIAVVSSEHAAGWGDFLHQVQSSSVGHLISVELFPAAVQGQALESEVLAALERIAMRADDFDAAVIIRGGGASIELQDFDSLALCQAICQMPLPVIVGIGPARDQTAPDLGAHPALKTPTAVAAFLVERMEAELSLVGQMAERLGRALRSIIDLQRQALTLCEARLGQAAQQRLMGEGHRLDLIATRLGALDPKLILRRGYSIATVGGRLITSAEQVRPGDVVVTTLSDGQITSTAL